MNLSQAKHAFITGGASGIGLAIGDALARRGLRITLADIDPESLNATVGSRGAGFRGVVLDVRDRDGWAVAKAEAEAAFGPVDVVVNNAGIAPDGAALADCQPESWDRIIAINLTGVFNGVHTFAADLRARRTGHILNVASMAGLSTSVQGTGAYSASKFAVVSLTETLRNEMAPHGVGVSVLCPGMVDTNLSFSTHKLGGSSRTPGKMPPGAMDAGLSGEMAVRGIERDALHILTHFDRFEPIRERFRVLEAAFRGGPDADLVG